MLKFIKVLTSANATVWVPRERFMYALDRQGEDTRVVTGLNPLTNVLHTKLKTKAICNMFAGPDWAPVHMKMRKAESQNGMPASVLRQGRICINPFEVRGLEAIGVVYDGDKNTTPSTVIHMVTISLNPEDRYVVPLPPSDVITLFEKATTPSPPEPQEQEGVNDETEIEDDEEENADS